jgi:hypothetical protein
MSAGRFWPLAAATLAAGCGVAGESSLFKADEGRDVFEGPVPRAVCGPGSIPEPGDVFQGDTPTSADGYRCNLEVVGFQPNVSPSWNLAVYEDCAYYDQDFPLYGAPNYKTPDPAIITDPDYLGTIVEDVSDPAHPRTVARLTTPAMIDPHESLQANQPRGLIGGVAGYDVVGNGPVYFDVYDVSSDCKSPVLTASLPVNIPTGHEGMWMPDGNTYFGSSLFTNNLTVIDTTDASAPRPLAVLPSGSHGLSFSGDGGRAYLADALNPAGNGLTILDTTQIQSRASNPMAPVVGSVTWDDGSTAQHTIPVTIKGKPYIVFTDEGGAGGTRIIDISDEANPRVISKLKLEIQMIDTTRQSHYCGVDREIEATTIACSNRTAGGLRVFDIRDPYAPREIAYFNLPDMYASARTHFVRERAEVWFTDQHSGFYVMRFTNGAWPFKE